MSGPQSWDEMKSGIARRKQQVRQRNQQIKKLKTINAELLRVLKVQLDSCGRCDCGACKQAITAIALAEKP